MNQRILTSFLGAAAWLAFLSAPLAAKPEAVAPAQLTIEWVEPVDFTDIQQDWGAQTEYDVEHVLPALKDELARVVGRLLPEGYTLALKVTDVDLAGDFNHPANFRGSHDVRVIRSTTPPGMEFTYTLTAPDGTTRTGEAKLRDLAFDFRIQSGSRLDTYRFEMSMLDDWLRNEFAAERRAAAQARRAARGR